MSLVVNVHAFSVLSKLCRQFSNTLAHIEHVNSLNATEFRDFSDIGDIEEFRSFREVENFRELS